MTYQALARKYRPKSFEAVVGQRSVVTALSNALNNNKLHHAYLFTGTHGTGKTTIARIFAKSLNCLTGISATPCGSCEHCIEIDAGRFPDLFEIDAASRTKVEDTRELLENIPFSPTKGKFKVYLIDEVHMLSGHSFNALLKTLEEPPAHVKFLLATTDPQKMPATVLSRCLQFHLSQISPSHIVEQLERILSLENISAQTQALHLLAGSAHGSMRDALSLLDQAIAYCTDEITIESMQQMLGAANNSQVTHLLQAIINQDANAALTLTSQWAMTGVNFKSVLTHLLTLFHTLATAQLTEKKVDDSLMPFLNALSPEMVQLYYQIALMGQQDLPHAPSMQMGFEMIVTRLIAFQPCTSSTTPKHKPSTEQVNRNNAPSTKAKTDSNTSPQTDWASILEALPISGPTRAFALQCTLSHLDEEKIALVVNAKHAALLSDRLKARLREALETHFGKPLQLSIQIQKQTTAQTPAQKEEAARSAKTESAKRAFSADPIVQRIVKTFDAKLVENSVETTL